MKYIATFVLLPITVAYTMFSAIGLYMSHHAVSWTVGDQFEVMLTVVIAITAFNAYVNARSK